MDICTLALLFFSFLFSISKRLLAKSKKLPPSPPSLPILGHLHLIKKPLHRSLTVLSNRYGPILSLRFGSRPVLLISSPSSADDCLSKNDIIFANRPRLLSGKRMSYNYSAIGWASYGSHWRNLRRIATIEILSSNRIKMFSAVRIQEVRSLVKDLFQDSELGKSVVELKTRFSQLTFNVMMGMIAGKRYYGEHVVDLEEARRFREIIKKVAAVAGVSNLGDFIPFLGWMDLGGVEKRMVRLARERDDFLLALINEHRRRRNKDDFSCEQGEGKEMKKTLIDVMLSLQETQPQYYTDHIIMGLIALQEVPGLAQRMAALMCIDIDFSSDAEAEEFESNGQDENIAKESIALILERELKKSQEKGPDAKTWLELEELDIDDDMLSSMDLSSKFPNLIALNLWGNKLKHVETVVREITRCRNLRAVWMNDNPVMQNCDSQAVHAILEGVPTLEVYNSRFTSNFGEWALGFCGGIYGNDKPCSSQNTDHPLEGITNLNLSSRCIQRLSTNKAFSPAEMPSLSYLNLRGNPLDQDSFGDLLKLLQGFTCLQALEVDIPGPLGKSASKILESLPNLSLLNGVSASHILESEKHVIDSMLQPRLPEWNAGEPLIDCVISAMWLYLMTYRLADEEKIDETSVWYVMDELGSAFRHSDEPNFRIAPFLYMPEGKLASAVSFSVLWPTQIVQKGEECTRDFLFGIGEDKQRSARLTAWFHTPQSYFIQEYEKYCQQLRPKSLCPPRVEVSGTQSILPSDGHALRVYTDLPHVEEFLTRPEFVIVNEPKDADIIWTCMQVDEEVKNAVGLKDHQYINQFPFEACLVMKHHLAETIHKAQGTAEWLQPTYNLETHLSELIGDYRIRKINGLNNLWILKPWNMARTIDTTVTGDLSAIIRLMETGPKICQKYIEHPALFNGKKFDIRYIVLVRSMNPLEIFLADIFWVRLANNPYSLDKSTLFEYETHFTVMNYIGKLNHMNTPDFVMEFEKEHQVKWLDIHQRVRNMIRAVFESAATVHPEMHSSFSRAMYGVDVMLDSTFQPKLLEVTYCPDCTRACKYDTRALESGDAIRGKDFFNLVFGCLFLNESTHVSLL